MILIWFYSDVPYNLDSKLLPAQVHQKWHEME